MLKQNIYFVKGLAAMFVTLIAMICYGPAEAAGLVWQNVRPTVATRGIATNGAIYVSASENGIFTSNNLSDWTRVSLPSGAGQSYNDIIWSSAGNEFVAVGLGTIVTSPDGSTWTAHYTDTSGLGVRLQSIIYANGTYVAVGTDTQGAVALVSTDGMSWQLNLAAAAPSGGSLEFDGVTWANAQYVAIGMSQQLNGGGDVLYTSTDASHWTVQTLPGAGSYGFNGDGGNDAAFANNTFVVGGSAGVYTSPDGVNWSAEFLPSQNANGAWFFGRIVAIGGKFFAAGVDQVNGDELAVFSSNDGITWNESKLNQTAPNLFYSNLDAIIAGGPGLVIGGDAGIATSTDASTWTFQPNNPIPIDASCAYFDHGVAVVLGDHYAVTSSDGIHWTAPTLSGSGLGLGGQGCMAANGALFVRASPVLAFSTNGTSWTQVTSSVTSTNGVANQDGAFFALANTNAAPPWEVQSSDGKAWSIVAETGLPSDGLIGTAGSAALTAGGGNLVTWGRHTNGGQPFMAVSSDGTQWTVVNGLPSALTNIIAVGFGGGTYIAVGSDASGDTLLLSSTDALHWSEISNLPAGTKNVQWSNISYGGGTWLISGVGGGVPGMVLVLTSAGGQNWSLQNLGVGALAATNSAWLGNGFVVATFNDILFAPVSTSGSGGGSGGGGGGSGGNGGSSGSSGGSGSVAGLSLIFLGLIAALCRRRLAQT